MGYGKGLFHMDLAIIRAALRRRLGEEGAQSVWISQNVVQAGSPAGVVTVVRESDEPYEAWLNRALLSFRECAVGKAA